MREMEYRANNGAPEPHEPEGRIEKTVHKWLDKIFKSKK